MTAVVIGQSDDNYKWFVSVAFAIACDRFDVFNQQVVCQNEREGDNAKAEASTLRSISHPNIVAYVDVFLATEQGLLQVCTVMEFCEKGDLAVFLGKTKERGWLQSTIKEDEIELNGMSNLVRRIQRERECATKRGLKIKFCFFSGGRIEEKRAANWMYQLAGSEVL
jgi:serine/threonine protein kinase